MKHEQPTVALGGDAFHIYHGRKHLGVVVFGCQREESGHRVENHHVDLIGFDDLDDRINPIGTLIWSDRSDAGVPSIKQLEPVEV